jgi:predicted Zn finger-like uncharacterized protein
MYTQCPHCDTAFRVTAPDLQRASGRVQCRGCGRDINALERLTEDPPEAARTAETQSIIESLEVLTGSHEIRIEDTGVEWRVVEDGEDEDAIGGLDDPLYPEAQHDGAGPEPAAEPEAEAATGDTASVRWYMEDVRDDRALLADVAAAAIADGPPPPHRQDPLPLSRGGNDSDVQRYDDNTPLPDDFLADPAGEAEPPLPQRRAEDRTEPRSPEADDAQVDLALGDAGDWMDLLDEVGNARTEGPTPAGVDPEATSDTVSRLRADDVEQEPDPDFPSDIDTQFDLQAIEMGIDLTGSRELADPPDDALQPETPEREPAEAAGAEAELALVTDRPEQDLATDAAPGEQIVAEAMAVPAGVGAEVPDGSGNGEWLALEDGDAAESTQLQRDEAEERRREQAFEQELASAWSIPLEEEPPPPANEGPGQEHFVPPQTEDEMTINRLIDQDLLRLAQQQNVFTSRRGHSRLEDSPQVETIILEGETVRTALEDELLAQEREVAGSPAHSSSSDIRRDSGPDEDDLILETYVKSKDRVPGGRRRTDPPGYRVIGGVVLLTLILAAQVVHAYRESLATYPAFDRTVGSVYRLFGKPVVPGWDIRDWQFESTSGSTDEQDQFLTLTSRIANNSGIPMPYPLLHVSLTDRWEEIIGSKVLEPSEYLAGTARRADRVSPGQHFTAVVRIESPSPDATGFKLNVCYREAGERVRCATEDFRD